MKLSNITPANVWWFARRKLNHFYGQFNPPMDYVISTYFEKNFVGTCIEVGAADGVSCSNTLHFEQKGWTCLCIEANPLHEESLRRNRKKVLMCAVSNLGAAHAKFHVAEMTTGVYEAVSALEIDKRLAESHKDILKGIREVDVVVKTLDECVGESGLAAVDFITIDTEGTELNVLKGFDLTRWKVKLLVIENNFNDPETGEYLSRFGYQLARRFESNDFYLLK